MWSLTGNFFTDMCLFVVIVIVFNKLTENKDKD